MADIAVVTGTTHGIGGVIARELAKCRLEVVMLCRNQSAALAIRQDILCSVAGALVHVIPCDLASFASVRMAAAEVRGRFGGIRLLINNAGITSMRCQRSEDGFELTFATNHLGPFLLTELLRDRVQPSGRIINTASRVHFRGGLDLADIRAMGSYNPLAAYAQSKLANVLHTFALARRLPGSGVTANCLHPGVVASNLLPSWLRLVKPFFSPQMFDVGRGALTTLHLALAAAVSGQNGKYFDEFQRPQPASAAANDIGLQEALWEASLRWTGLAPAIRGSSSSRQGKPGVP